MRRIEMIDSYIINDCDLQFNDNHGVLIRCRKCKYYNKLMHSCPYNSLDLDDDDYCSRGVQKDEN